MKLYVAMVGLPARGKRTLAKRIRSGLEQQGIRTAIFNNGELRRTLFGLESGSAEFFNPDNTRARRLRDQITHQNMERARAWLDDGGDVAIIAMGLMVAENQLGVSLAGIIADFFTNISNNVTFPVLTFLSAGIINFFVPSGGGQWAVQAPIVMPAATEMGVEYGRAAMAIAWGDQWTNMIQPFWALPALGIAGLKARNIMGYLVIVLIFTGVVACLGFLGWGLFFHG